jgi:hypothetical protein
VSLAGIGLTIASAGRQGLQQLGRRLVPDRSSLGWGLVVVAGYLAITACALQGAALVQSSAVVLPTATAVLSGMLNGVFRDPGPIGEEFGWRGYALPRLLERFPPLTASLRLGMIHAAWHLPLFFIASMPQANRSLPLFTIGVISIAVFDTALYQRSDANLLLAIVVHLMANVCGGLAADARALNWFFVLEGVAAGLVVGLGGLTRAEPSSMLAAQYAPVGPSDGSGRRPNDR